jgi:hypothetical protein
MSNNYIPIKNPFEGITDPNVLLTRYNKETLKARKLVGNYSIKKLNWLLEKATEQRNIIEKNH